MQTFKVFLLDHLILHVFVYCNFTGNDISYHIDMALLCIKVLAKVKNVEIRTELSNVAAVAGKARAFFTCFASLIELISLSDDANALKPWPSR